MRQRNTVSEETIESVGAGLFKKIVDDCRRLYAKKLLPPILRPPSKTRQLVENQIVPYIEQTNIELTKRKTGILFTVECEYESVASNHPTYSLQVRRMYPRAASALLNVRESSGPTFFPPDASTQACTSNVQLLDDDFDNENVYEEAASGSISDTSSKYNYRRFSI
ncbi:Hypothetical Protein FCC1311_003552 [Hondaea fermentalgiana]|uniref:Uncharacterized protein n=1 Tax=Hondaea fermentalgiana TaxID=2315210 RepID=A0A2R5FZF5_9STRA|nr:Hypothetical Protein FCC1311_003552 [Hondaea fermentalgiana]|eukprot:GBG24137.1 Hypothetical Protein FCC1311_003552 [Hondaea fermentalgiana]